MELSAVIKAYTAGRINVGEFRLAMAGKINIDGKLDRVIRQHEAGDTVSFATLGTMVFRQLDKKCDTYNRVDKVNMNDPAQVCPANATRPFVSPQ